MATKNLIPRASGEGGIGIENVTWGEAYFDTGNFNKGLYISGNPIDAVVSQTITQGGLGGKWNDGATAGDIYYNGGSVGIGTASPGAALEVAGNDPKLDLVRNLVGGGVNGIELKSLGDGTTTNERSALIDLATPGSGTEGALLKIAMKNGAATYADNLCLKDGNVGIGTTNPEHAKLQIHGSTTTGVRAGLLLHDSNGGRSSAIHQVGNLLKFDDYTQGLTSIAIDGLNGNVGIGTTNPKQLLHLEGADSSSQIAGFHTRS